MHAALGLVFDQGRQLIPAEQECTLRTVKFQVVQQSLLHCEDLSGILRKHRALAPKAALYGSALQGTCSVSEPAPSQTTMCGTERA